MIYGVFAFAPGTLLAIYLNSVKNRMNEENEKLRQEHISEEMQAEAAHQQKDAVLMQMIDELRERIQQLEREARDDTIANKIPDTATATATAPMEGDATDLQAAMRKKTGKLATNSEASTSATQTSQVERRELPAFLAEYEDSLRPWMDRLDTMQTHMEKIHGQISSIFEGKSIEKENEELSSMLRTKMTLEKAKATASAPQQGGIRERIADRERELIAEDIRAHKKAAAQNKPQ